MSDARIYKRVHDITVDTLPNIPASLSNKRIRTSDETQLKRRSPSPELLNKKAHTESKTQLIHYDGNLMRPLVISLDPSQRLDLLKRRQRWRQSTYYNIKNNRVNAIRSTIIPIKPQTIEYADMATQTDYVPSLKSQNSLVKKNAKVEAEKKLRSGVFSGELLYEKNDIDENDNRERSPVRFPDDKRPNKNALPLSQNALNALVTDKKKLVQIETQPIIEEPKKAANKPLGPSAGFNFLSSKKIEQIKDSNFEEPPKKKPLSLGANITTDNLETSTPSVADKSKSKPTLSFGNSAPAPAPSLSSVGNKENPSGGLFNFGSATEKTNDDKQPFSLNSSKEDKTDNPTFNFGSNGSKVNSEKNSDEERISTGFSFGSKKDDRKPITSGFSFAAKPEDKVNHDTAKPFSFGANAPASIFKKPSLVDASEGKEESAKPSITFGSTTTDNEKEVAHNPSFSFPTSSTSTSLFSKPEEKKNNDSKLPLLSNYTTKKNDVSKPAFSFGSTIEKKDDNPQPAFSFGSGTSTENKPAPSFSFTAKPANSSKPASLFGASTEKKDENDQPNKKKSINFGASSSSASTTEKPSFSFGSTTSKPEEPVKPSFSFGTVKPADSAPVSALGGASKPSFNFGATQLPTTSSTPVTEKSSLFGADSKAAESKPQSFNFGSSAASQNPANVFGTSNLNTNPTIAFNFGSTSTPSPAPAALFGQQPANPPTSFNFGTSTVPSFVSSNGNSISSAGSNTQFTFGGAPAAADPANIFGQAVSTANAFGKPAPQQSAFGGFNGFSSPAPSGFSSQQVPSFVGGSTPFVVAGSPSIGTTPGTPSQPAQSRVPGRKIAQMRSRRR